MYSSPPPYPLVVGSATPATPALRLPSYETLRTIKTALEVFVLALALPWLVHELVFNPGGLTRRVARHHMS